jgi:hypothetical protein
LCGEGVEARKFCKGSFGLDSHAIVHYTLVMRKLAKRSCNFSRKVFVRIEARGVPGKKNRFYKQIFPVGV